MKLSYFIFTLIWIFPMSHAYSSGKTAPSGLLCELLSHPELSVITNPKPGFSWIINSKLNEDYQTAYQIMVAVSEEKLESNKDLFWNSGKIKSGQSSNLEYNGIPLTRNSSFIWKVRTWNKEDKPSEWSRPQRFNTGEFNILRKWPGESRWVQIELYNGKKLWTLENRHPIIYHNIEAVNTVRQANAVFFDFGRSAFSVPKIQYTWKPVIKSGLSDTIQVFIGEKAVGDSIDRKPGGGVLFRKYSFGVKPGTHTEMLQLPRFVPHYPQSQVMPAHMPEVIPFRYVEIRSANAGVVIEKVSQQALYYLFDEDASYFSCSDTLLNKVYNLCRYSVKTNTFNGDYAASERERMMYEADCYIHQMSHYAVDREFAIARYSLESMIFHATWPTEWIFHTILMAYADYRHTGNTEIIEKYFPELSAKLMLNLASGNYLISTKTGKQTPEFLKSINYNGKGLIDIIDWPHGGMGLVKTNGETDNYDFVDYNTVVNAFHFKSLVVMSEMAGAVGKKVESLQFQNRAALVKNAFNKAFLNREKGIYVDGIGSNHSSLHANMFALAFGLVEDEYKPGVISLIKSKGMACGVYGANYLLEALFNEKEADYALSLLTSETDRSWMNMLNVGSTITTEAWDNKYKSNNGWSHAWSSSPAHIIPRKIMGIEPMLPGFEKIHIAPQPGSLLNAKCKLPTIKGPVLVEFSQKPGESFLLSFEIPAGTSAQIVLPSICQDGAVVFDGKPFIPEYRGNDRLLTSGSGSHTIKIHMKKKIRQ